MGHHYKLDVLQQPLRARMCGLGDKDRRQISPPPCIKLTIYDEAKQLVNIDECDISQLILIAELYSVDETRNLSIVKSMNSILNLPTNASDIEPYNSISSSSSSSSSINDGNGQASSQHQQSMNGISYNNIFNVQQQSMADIDPNMTYVNDSSSKKTSPIRNLIGCVVTNAFKLYDQRKEKGIWFIMQDLSIRIEGDFKIKFSLFNIQSMINYNIFNDSQSSDSTSTIEEFDALSFVFSDAFKVYSAKKFPGVIESSELSKIFAAQGVKIPIRRDSKERDEDD